MAMNKALTSDATPEFSIFAVRRALITSLQGYRPSHFAADRAADRQRYLAQIGHRDLEQELDGLFVCLREKFGFRRRQLQVGGPADGCGLIATPDFDLEITLLPDPDNGRGCLWRRTVSSIRQRHLMMDERLQSLLQPAASGLQISMRDDFDPERLIDLVEECCPSGLVVDYDRTATWCELSIPDLPVRVRIDAGLITVTGRNPVSPAELVAGYAAFQTRFAALLPRWTDGAPTRQVPASQAGQTLGQSG